MELQKYQQCFHSIYVHVFFITVLSTLTIAVDDDDVNKPPYTTVNAIKDETTQLHVYTLFH